MNKSKKIILTGGAGLVGQNLVLELKNNGYSNIVVVDKNSENLKILTNSNERPELAEYVSFYWPSITSWSDEINSRG